MNPTQSCSAFPLSMELAECFSYALNCYMYMYIHASIDNISMMQVSSTAHIIHGPSHSCSLCFVLGTTQSLPPLLLTLLLSSLLFSLPSSLLTLLLSPLLPPLLPTLLLSPLLPPHISVAMSSKHTATITELKVAVDEGHNKRYRKGKFLGKVRVNPYYQEKFM